MPCQPVGFISDAALASMNAAMERTFDTVIVILRDAGTRALDGGQIEDFRPVGLPVKGAAWQPGNRNRLALTDGATPAVSDWTAMLPVSADVRTGDRLEAGALTLLVSGTDAGATDAVGQVLTCKRVN